MYYSLILHERRLIENLVFQVGTMLLLSSVILRHIVLAGIVYCVLNRGVTDLNLNIYLFKNAK